MAFAEDLSVFLDGDDFAVQALINNSPFTGIFDHEELVEGDVLVERPVLLMATADTAGFEKGDPVVVNATNYSYFYQLDDGTGLSRVVLKKRDG